MNKSLEDNVPGKSTRAMANRRRQVRILLALTGIAVIVSLFFVNLTARNALISLGVLVVVVVIDHAVIPDLDFLKNREGDATRGAKAEEAIGAILNRLPIESHIVLHDIAADYGNIDHLVFRRDGAVFLIETKAHGGEVTERHGELRLNGHAFEKDVLKQTHGNVYWLRDFLKAKCGIEVWINAAIVFPNAYVSVRRTIRGVDIVNAKYLGRWMSKVRGNPQIARALWPQVQELKAALLTRQLEPA